MIITKLVDEIMGLLVFFNNKDNNERNKED